MFMKCSWHSCTLPEVKILPGAANGLNPCGNCRQVRYCSKEHQKLDWKTHKILCKRFSEQLRKAQAAPNPPSVIDGQLNQQTYTGISILNLCLLKLRA
jgi:hypothetical protein